MWWWRYDGDIKTEEKKQKRSERVVIGLRGDGWLVCQIASGRWARGCLVFGCFLSSIGFFPQYFSYDSTRLPLNVGCIPDGTQECLACMH